MLEDVFPELLRYKACGIMFYEKETDSLFSIKIMKEGMDRVVKYPPNDGCSG
jgi:hypothetical protein